MKPIRTGVLWILSTSAVLLSTGAIADIPPPVSGYLSCPLIPYLKSLGGDRSV
jgi:hypothetical protein